MEIIRPAVQVERIDQANKPEYMVAMQVADKDMVNPAYLGPVLNQLHLGTFATIYQKIVIFKVKQLASLVPAVSRSCGVSS